MSHVTRANRAAAAGFMLEVGNRQERFLLDNCGYATSISPLTASGLAIPSTVTPYYTVTVTSPRSGVTTPSYLIRSSATPASISSGSVPAGPAAGR